MHISFMSSLSVESATVAFPRELAVDATSERVSNDVQFCATFRYP